MKIIHTWLAERRRKSAALRLAATMKPCPELRARRLAAMHGERKLRALRNMSDIHAELRGNVR